MSFIERQIYQNRLFTRDNIGSIKILEQVFKGTLAERLFAQDPLGKSGRFCYIDRLLFVQIDVIIHFNQFFL